MAKPPLIEAIAEVRWGKIDDKGNVLEFPENEKQFFIGQFKAIASQKDFNYIERINKALPDLFPHAVTFRFRKEENTWPCYQIGYGIFTVNQIIDGYKWETFKEDIIFGLDLLDKGHPDGLGSLFPLGVELRYQDGYIYEEKYEPENFLKKAFKVELGLLSKDFKSPELFEQELQGIITAFKLRTIKPSGILIFELKQGLINGQKGFIADTIVRSTGNDAPEFTVKNLSDWFEQSHDLQRHAFKNLLNPAYMEGLK